jgi:acyl carrier protein
MTMSDSLTTFVANFTTAVDFQDAVELRADSVLADLPEWDSLAALGVIVMCDMEYGVTITGNELAKCTTVQDVHGIVLQKKG